MLQDRYRLIRTLGEGGMGRVWLAEDMWLKRFVALKQLTRSGDESAELAKGRRRVLREAQALASVKHSAIVPIHDYFVVKGAPWIVMEYIEGETLDKHISAGQLDEQWIARIGLQVLDGLIAAHHKGVIHRDVKPANILVAAADGAAVLIDFGIARSPTDSSLTGTAIVGTIEYLSPERLEPGAKAHAPADIWALGVTLFYALEGYSPFHRFDWQDTLAIQVAITRETPSVTRHGPLADITLRMLEKNPAKRVRAAEIRQALSRVVAAKRARVVPPQSVQSARVPQGPVQRVRPKLVAEVSGLRDEIAYVGPARGAGMLAALELPTAARVIAECPVRDRGALVQGIAAIDPAAAARILPMLLAGVAGRAFGELESKTAASLLTAMPAPEAARILSSTDTPAAASAIMELPPGQAAEQLKAMRDAKRAADVLARALSRTALAIAIADPLFALAVLPYLADPLRTQVKEALEGDT